MEKSATSAPAGQAAHETVRPSQLAPPKRAQVSWAMAQGPAPKIKKELATDSPGAGRLEGMPWATPARLRAASNGNIASGDGGAGSLSAMAQQASGVKIKPDPAPRSGDVRRPGGAPAGTMAPTDGAGGPEGHMGSFRKWFDAREEPHGGLGEAVDAAPTFVWAEVGGRLRELASVSCQGDAEDFKVRKRTIAALRLLEQVPPDYFSTLDALSFRGAIGGRTFGVPAARHAAVLDMALDRLRDNGGRTGAQNDARAWSSRNTRSTRKPWSWGRAGPGTRRGTGPSTPRPWRRRRLRGRRATRWRGGSGRTLLSRPRSRRPPFTT